jgi:short-subunit dehydrogenase involved in D-alanine esterification of teichoic acids
MSVDVPEILTCICDVSEKEQVQAFASEVAKTFDVKQHRLLLFNNAGIGGGNSFFAKKMSGSEFLISTGRVHTTCVGHLCRSLLPHLLAML